MAGCNLFYNPDLMIPMTNLNFLSPDSKCYSFDHRANGYSRGEGFGVVVLKRLADALRDGDMVRAVIRATGTNQDGRTPGLVKLSNMYRLSTYLLVSRNQIVQLRRRLSAKHMN